MDRILVEIICPSLAKKWDFWISVNATVAETRKIIIDEITEYEKLGDLVNCLESVMIYNHSGEILNENFTIKESGVCSGDSLMII